MKDKVGITDSNEGFEREIIIKKFHKLKINFYFDQFKDESDVHSHIKGFLHIYRNGSCYTTGGNTIMNAFIHPPQLLLC